RLRDVHRLGGTAEVAELGHRAEGEQVVEVEVERHLMRSVDQSFATMQFPCMRRKAMIRSMPSLNIPCVLMRAGTSRGPFFLRGWRPQDEAERDQALIGAIGASDLLQVDGVGGGSTLTSKVAIVSRSVEPGCDVDYLFAQVGVG